MINVSFSSADLSTARKRSLGGHAQSSSTMYNADVPFSDPMDANFVDSALHSMLTTDVSDIPDLSPSDLDLLSHISADNARSAAMFSQMLPKEHEQPLFKNPADSFDFSEDINMDMFPNSPTGLFLNTSEPHTMPLDTTHSHSPPHLYTSSISSTPSSSPSSSTETKQEQNPENAAIASEFQTSPTPSQRSSISHHKSPSLTLNASPSSSSSLLHTAVTSPSAQDSVKVKREVSEALTNYQFGREWSSSTANAASLSPQEKVKLSPSDRRTGPSYMPDFNPEDWESTQGLKYGLQIQDVPSKSRVETQIRVVMNFYPPPNETIVHLPADTISKPKLQLRSPFVPIPSALTVDTVVVCDSDLTHYVNICQGCMKRERKRAFRKKVRLPIEEAHWQQDKEKRAIVFNCREVVDFGPLKDIEVDGQTVQSRQIELPMRMACYCRHHNEKNGFRAFFVVRDHLGTVVARGSTKSIMITDDHKATNLKTSSTGVKRSNSDVDAPDHSAVSTRQSSPVQDEPTFAESSQVSQPAPRKRKTVEQKSVTQSFAMPKPDGKRVTAVPQRHRSAVTSPQSFSPISTPTFDFALHSPVSPRQNGISAYQRTSSLDNLSSLMSRSVMPIPSPNASPVNVLSPPKQSVDDWVAQDSNLPTIQRIIPASGSIRGGIEVTLLGNGFINGLVAKFGENNSVSTHCWSSTTIVATLPASRFPGPVVVTFEGFAMPDPQLFSYYDDTDRQLIELALQVVGLKMNGRLEDARDIARRIVGSGPGSDPNQVHQRNSAYIRATNMSLDNLDSLLLKCLDLIDCYQSNYMPNWQLANSEGQTMLHLAASLGLKQFPLALLARGLSADIQDKTGFTSLHFAALHHHDHLITLLLRHGASPHLRTYSGITYTQLREEVVEPPITQRSFKFNDDGDSSDDSDETEEEILDEPHPDLTQRVSSYIASWRDAAVLRMTSPVFETAEEPQHHIVDSNLWDLMYPNTGEISLQPDTSTMPPSYEEIFPDGSSSGADFSRAALDDKPSTQEETPAEEEGVPSEEEVLEAWKNNRKKLQNDRMFLFFWLPVFIFMLVWVSMKAVTFFDGLDVSAYLHDKISATFNEVIGVKKLTQIMPATTGFENEPPGVI